MNELIYTESSKQKIQDQTQEDKHSAEEGGGVELAKSIEGPSGNQGSLHFKEGLIRSATY